MPTLDEILDEMIDYADEMLEELEESDPGPLPEPPQAAFVSKADRYIGSGNRILSGGTTPTVPTPQPTLTIPSNLTLYQMVELMKSDANAAKVAATLNETAQHVKRGVEVAAIAKDVAVNGP